MFSAMTDGRKAIGSAIGSRGPRVALLLALALPMATATTVAAAELAVGDRAPDFEMQGSDGRSYTLNDVLAEGGREGIVLAWFPKAFTPG